MERVDTPSTPRSLEDAVVGMIERLRAAHDVAHVGVAAAGFIDRDRSLVYHAPNIAWRNEPLRERLEARVGIDVTIENDANAAGWAEYRFGAGRGVHDMVMLTMGTGVGGRDHRERGALPRRLRRGGGTRPRALPARGPRVRLRAERMHRDVRVRSRAAAGRERGGGCRRHRRGAGRGPRRSTGLISGADDLAARDGGRSRRAGGAGHRRHRARGDVRRIPGDARPRAVRDRRRESPSSAMPC